MVLRNAHMRVGVTENPGSKKNEMTIALYRNEDEAVGMTMTFLESLDLAWSIIRAAFRAVYINLAKK